MLGQCDGLAVDEIANCDLKVYESPRTLVKVMEREDGYVAIILRYLVVSG